MVLALPRFVTVAGAAQWVARLVSWVLLLAIAIGLAWAYLANPQPSPYGSCYAARGRPMPCELVKKR